MATRKARPLPTTRRSPAPLPGVQGDGEAPLKFPSWRGVPRSAANARMASCVVIPAAWGAEGSHSASRGAEAILGASPWIGGYEEDAELDPIRHGVFTTAPVEAADGRELVAKVEEIAGRVLDAAQLPVVLGGDRVAGLGTVRALKARGREFAVVMVDAHRHIQEEGTTFGPLTNWFAAGVCRAQVPIAMVGHRGLVEIEAEALRRSRIPQLPARRLVAMDPARACVEALRTMPQCIHVSVDLSVLDPIQFPAVELPLPFGVGFDWLANFLRLLVSSREVVAVDLCGYSPAAGPPACATLAAGLLNRLMATMAKGGTLRRDVVVAPSAARRAAPAG
jgi:arginase family enzyme